MKTQSSYLVKTAVAGVLGLSMVGAANASVVLGGGGLALQDVLDDHTVSALGKARSDSLESDVGLGDNTTDTSLSSINVNTNQFAPDEMWAITGSGGSISTMIIELAGFANTNSFGVYDLANPSNNVELFDGAASAGAQASLAILLDGSVLVNFTDTGIDFASGNLFGFYLNVAATGNTWYSQTAGNTDGEDHMVAYQGNDSDIIQLGAFSAGEWTSSEYILAWEDLAGSFGSGSDRDFTDFVVIVESVHPMPEPSILALLGLGLLGLVGGRRFTKA